MSSLPSASNYVESRSCRRGSSSTTRRHRTPPDSDLHQSQTTFASRNSSHMSSDREIDNRTKTALLVLALSYEDRHYRPAGEPSSAVVETQATDRHFDLMNGRDAEMRPGPDMIECHQLRLHLFERELGLFLMNLLGDMGAVTTMTSPCYTSILIVGISRP